MVSLRQHLQSLPSLGVGIAVGLVLALIVWRSGGVAPTMVLLVTGLPFLLAGLTGIAKTTTA